MVFLFHSSEPATVAEIRYDSSTVTTSVIPITWSKPANTVLDRYELSINPNDGSEILPLQIDE